MALIDDLSAMAKLLHARQDSAFYDRIYGGRSIMDRLPAQEPRYDRNPIFGGVKVIANPMFPYEQTCSKCGGSGEGAESTYCPTCKGAGRYRIEGVMAGVGDKLAVLTHYYPAKPVQWPAHVAVPMRSIPGIRSVPLPANWGSQ